MHTLPDPAAIQTQIAAWLALATFVATSILGLVALVKSKINEIKGKDNSRSVIGLTQQVSALTAALAKTDAKADAAHALATTVTAALIPSGTVAPPTPPSLDVPDVPARS